MLDVKKFAYLNHGFPPFPNPGQIERMKKNGSAYLFFRRTGNINVLNSSWFVGQAGNRSCGKANRRRTRAYFTLNPS